MGGIEDEQHIIAIVENTLKIKTTKDRKIFFKSFIENNQVLPIETTWNKEPFAVKRIIVNTSENILAKIVYCVLRDEVMDFSGPILIEDRVINEVDDEEDQ